MKIYASSLVFALLLFTFGGVNLAACGCGGCGCGGAKKATRAEPGGGCKGCKNRGCGGGGCEVASVECDANDSAAMEKASNGNKPIVVLFAGEKTDVSTYFQGQDYVDMKDSDAVFIAVPFTSDRTPAPGAKDSIVPVSKLAGDNPSRDFGLRVGEECVMILDSFGNFDDVGTKFMKKPTAKELKEVCTRMPSKVEAASKKLQKALDSANSLLAKGDRNGAFKAAVKVLDYGLVGYSASNEAAKIYNTICDEVVAEIGTIKAGDSKEATKRLGELGSVYNKKNAPTVAAEIDSAKKEIKSAQ